MKDTEAQRRLIVVLGMHRSGTSTIMKAVEHLGVSIGDSLMPAAEGNNSKGFFEDLDVYHLNERMLSALKTTWYDSRPIDSAAVNFLILEGFLNEAVELLQQRLARFGVYGFKEPRTTKLALFWKDVFNKLNCRVDYILALRHPYAVAKSLNKRDGLDDFRSQILWLSYQLSALSAFKDENWILQSYDDLIAEPEIQLRLLASRLNVSFDIKKAREFSENFVDVSLMNFKSPSLGERKTFALPIIEDVFMSLSEKDERGYKKPADEAVERWMMEFHRSRNHINYIEEKLEQISDLQSRIDGNKILVNGNQRSTQCIEACTYFGVKTEVGIVYAENISSKHLVGYEDGINTIRFKPNVTQNERIGGIRFDISNTPCLAYIFEISVISGRDDSVIWEWKPESHELPWSSIYGIEFLSFIECNQLAAIAVNCVNDDPQMHFDFPSKNNSETMLNEIQFEVKFKVLPIEKGIDVPASLLNRLNESVEIFKVDAIKAIQIAEINLSESLESQFKQSDLKLADLERVSNSLQDFLLLDFKEHVSNLENLSLSLMKTSDTNVKLMEKIGILESKLESKTKFFEERESANQAAVLNLTERLDVTVKELSDTALALEEKSRCIEMLKKSILVKAAMSLAKFKI